MKERHTQPYVFGRSKLRPRQTQRPTEPPLSLDGDETSSDESGLDGESDSEGEDDSSDEEEEAEDANPFAASRVSGTGTQASISATTSTRDNPFATSPAVTGSPSSETRTSTITASPTSQNLVATSAPEVASTSSVPGVSSSGGQPQHTTAIALGSVLGVLSVAIGAYLLFRYCTPLKTRVAAFRGRRGSKLPGEEDGTPPQQLGGGMVQSGEFGAMNAFRYSKAASSIATPAPAYTRNIAIAVPITSTRAPAPISIHSGSRDDDPANPFSDYARSLSRNNSNNSTRSRQRSVQNSGTSDYENSRPATDMLGEPGTYAFNFSFDDYRMSGTDIRRTGLTNSTPSGTSGPGANSRSNSVKRSVAPYPSDVGPGMGLGVDMSPQTPKPSRFSIPYASPSEVATPRTQYMPRQRQSITPSESVSNAPYSPLPFPAGLMPAMPGMNSRWSKNSSSVWARTVDDRGTNLPEAPARVVSRPPPLPLTVRTSTSSQSSLSSSGSMRSSSRDSGLGDSPDSSEKRSTLQPPSTQRLKTASAIIGLPSSVRPVSNTGSGVTLKPVAYRP
jgi:hypothetical protein